MAQAPQVEQLASLNTDAIRIVAVGTFDDADEAANFQERTQTDAVNLVWSESPEIWQTYEVSSQHTTVLLDSNGAEIQRWNNFDPNAVAAALG